ncbi:hypothetical protein AHAS_Ahas06G0192300 [Arachis hypogaea]
MSLFIKYSTLYSTNNTNNNKDVRDCRDFKYKRVNLEGQAVKLNRAKLEACLTCPLCNKLFNNATTNFECLHTFCRECIDKKLIYEQLKHCLVCNADLGCSPLDKLSLGH